ncbi:hypothetical protein M408DRAFT_65698, partial [Serendipita vermifera MAFF 305830]
IDAGDFRGLSQMKILSALMHEINKDQSSNEKKKPCDVFDMIGGTGTGGWVFI